MTGRLMSSRGREHRQAVAAPRRREQEVHRGWWAAHLLVLAGTLVVLLLLNSRQWFFGDDWAFIVGRSFQVEDLLRPHNEHWMLVSTIVLRGLERTVGYANYAVYAAPAVIAHLIALHLLWRMALRAGAYPAVALVGAALPALFPLGEENLTFAVNVGFNVSLAVGLAQMLLVDADDVELSHRDVLGSVLAIVGVASSGLSLILVPAAGAVAALRRRYLAAALAVGPAAAVYLVWYVTAGPPRTAAPERPLDVVADAATIAGSALSWLVSGGRLPVGAALIVLVMAAATLLRDRSRRPVLPAVAAAAALGVAFLIAWGRGAAPDALPSPRYLYAPALLLSPAIVLGADAVARKTRATTIVIPVALLAIAASGWPTLAARAGERAEHEQRLRERYLVSAQLLRAGQVDPLGERIDRSWAPDLYPSGLLAFVPPEASADPDLSRPRREVELEAELELGTLWTASPRAGGDRPLTVVRVVDAEVSEQDGCMSIAGGTMPTVHLAPQPEGRIDLFADEPGSLWVGAERGGVRTAHPRHLIVGRADRHLYVRVDGASLELSLPPGELTTACNVRLADGAASSLVGS